MQIKSSKSSRQMLKRILSFLVLITLIITPLTLNDSVFSTTKAATTVDVGPTKNMADGAILHAWCWSFNTIKNNMSKIADAGYTSVQTSPINNTVVGNGGDLKFTNQWWYHYQPTDYKIGNYQLGSESEFAAMCAEAEKYGIKIIVDVVANHCTSNYNLITSEIKNKANFFHTNKEITNWNDRYQVTQLALLGLWDNNTQNSTVQEYIKNFLIKCVSLGADGFRYDAAKHIELPDDGNYGGNFWPNVLNNGAEFQYGEILQDSISRESSYANYMSVTASAYGKKIRDNIGSNNLNASTIGNFDINVNSKKIVTWVESHDNYANDIHDYGSSQWMTDEQIKLAWAIVCARNGGTPLFFSRPVGGGGSSWDNRFPEKTKIGDLGSSLFFDDEVAAVNKFRNAMVGENEYLRNPNGNNKILMIERGNKGITIINMNYSSTYLSSTTNLANGSYTNKTDDNSTFTVSNGTITGTLPGRSVVVLYQGTTTPTTAPTTAPTTTPTTAPTTGPGTGVTVKFEKPSSWGNNLNAYVYDESGSYVKQNASWPGVAMTNNNDGTYSYTFTGSYSNPLVIFNDGNNQSPGAKLSGFALVNNGTYTTNGLKSVTTPTPVPTTTPAPTTTPTPGNKVTIYYKTSWSNANIHYQIGSNSWTTAPGVAMSVADVSGYKTITIDLGTATTLTACFNNGSGNWDNNSQKNYTFNAGTYTLTNSAITNGAPKTNSNSVTIYYYTTWSNANIHYQVGSNSWTSVPGVNMNQSYGGYKIITINLGTSSTLTACFNNGNGNWDNNYGRNYYFTSGGTYSIKNNTISNGTP